MRISLFSDIHDVFPRRFEGEWADVVALIGPHKFSTAEKQSTPAFSPAVWPEDAVSKTEDGVQCVSAFVLDVDHAHEDQALSVAAIARELGLAAVLYSSWSHATKPWSFRLVIPLTREVLPDEWPAFWVRANGVFEGVGDSKCKNIGRLYYLPYAPVGTEARHFRKVFEGLPLDVDLVLSLPEPTAPKPSKKLSREAFEAFAKKLVRSSNTYRAELGGALKKIANGDEFAEEGERDDLSFKLSCLLAEEFPKHDPTSIAQHFFESLQLMARIAPGAPTVDDVAKKIRKQQESLKVEKSIPPANQKIRQAFGNNGRADPYSDDELKSFGEFIGQRWIAQKGSSYYFFFDGAYRGPYGENEMLSAATVYLAPAISAGVYLHTLSEKGDLKQKNSQTLVAEYGTVAEKVVVNLSAQKSSFDGEIFMEAACPLRNIEPKFHEEIDTWLRLLAGEKTKKLLCWLAAVTKLDRPCVALVLIGPHNAGKSLLACGLSKLWNEIGQPTDMSEVLGTNFNEALLKCPLCVADEELPQDFRGNPKIQPLKYFIQQRTGSLKRKFLASADLVGACRIMITANSQDIFASGVNQDFQEIGAIVDRLLLIEASEKATEFLERVVGEKALEDWVEGGKIAEHALWLRDNHKWQPNGRFMIEIEDESLGRNLSVREHLKSSICQWLIGYLKEPEKFDNDARGNLLVRKKKGRLLVNAQGLVNCWDTYVSQERCQITGKVSRALAGLCEKDHLLKYEDNRGKKTDYRIVSIENLITWAESHGLSNRETILEALKEDTKESKSKELN